MPVKIRTAQELAQLTPAEKRAAEHLVAGASNTEGAQALGISTTTFTGYIVAIGKKFQVTSRSGRPARAHAVLASGQVSPPPAPEPIADFTERDLRLLRALAENAETHAIARAAEIAPADVRPMIADLVDKAGAANDTHLVGLGHAWGFLNTDPSQLAGSARFHAADRPLKASRSPWGATPTTAGSSATRVRR
ncbi:LuxR C-terminal-related transcriptional regulator [Streptomyces sp. NPDC059637]|uniref:LuxR C-terminal-related transcriptional regulator n=1 Tax=Streptomyces sp. NPDC059637 TaxID=3347752 RepID=UPI0036B63D7E